MDSNKTQIFISTKCKDTSVAKLTTRERTEIESIVASLTIKRIPESEIIKVYNQTNKTITKRFLHYVKQQIKRETFKWYETMREGKFEYIHLKKG